MELTINEVQHSREAVACDLFVVDNIRHRGDGNGGYNTSGGKARLWSDWSAVDSALSPTRFRYDLPNSQALDV